MSSGTIRSAIGAIAGALIGRRPARLGMSAANLGAMAASLGGVEPPPQPPTVEAYETQGSFGRRDYSRYYSRADAQRARGAANRKAKNRALRVVQEASRARNRRA